MTTTKEAIAAIPTWGFELEMLPSDERQSWSRRVVEMFRNNGLTEHERLCAYHCSCAICAYDRRDGFLAAQTDSTVAMEFVSRILTDDDWGDVARTAEVLEDVWKTTRYRPSGPENWGNHVHVFRPGEFIYDSSPLRRWACALMADERLDWNMLACGGRLSGQIRGYNGRKPSKNPAGWDRYNDGSPSTGWLADKMNTTEYRVWNTPAEVNRLSFHVAASVAIQRWAYLNHNTADRFAVVTAKLDARPFQDTLDQIASVWPNTPEREAHLAFMSRAVVDCDPGTYSDDDTVDYRDDDDDDYDDDRDDSWRDYVEGCNCPSCEAIRASR